MSSKWWRVEHSGTKATLFSHFKSRCTVCHFSTDLNKWKTLYWHNVTWKKQVQLTEMGLWWAFNWFVSSIQTPVLCPSSTKLNRENIFSWHMLWHPYNWGSCQHTTPTNPECNVDSEWDITALRESFKMDKCGVLASLGLWVCVCVFFFCPSLHVSTRQLEPWPPVGLAGLPPVKAWEPSEEKKKTWRLLHKNMVQLPPTHTCEHRRTHSVAVKGFTSPQPDQWGMLNFDPSHYLPRRWSLGWGDNLWTLTFNPEVWAGPC